MQENITHPTPEEAKILEEQIQAELEGPLEDIDAARELIDEMVEKSCENMEYYPTDEETLMIKETVNQFLDQAKNAGYTQLSPEAFSVYVVGSIIRVQELSKTAQSN